MKTLQALMREGGRLPFGAIDMHGHFGRYGFPIADLSAAGLTAVMDRVGVERMVCSHMQCMSADAEWGNAEVRTAMDAAPGRILGYVSVFPGDADAGRAVERWLERGFTGLKFHNSNGFPYDHPGYGPALEVADRLRRPVLLHTWGQEAEFSAALAIARRHPGLSILLAHSGCSNLEGYARTARGADNIFLDTCFSRAARGLVERLTAEVGAGKVVWGSDCYFYAMTQQIGRVLGARLSDADKERILRTNAAAILDRARQP